MLTTPRVGQRFSATTAIASYYLLRAATVAYFGLHDVLLGMAGAEYPVLYSGQVVGRRWKACRAWLAAHPHTLKYQQLGARPYFPLYHLDAVRAGEPVVLAAGEPDVWCLHQAGIAACTFLMGEGTVPAAGVRLLAEKAPSLVTVIYDLDPPGRVGAERAYQALVAAGLETEIATLPPDLGYGGDVADLYRRLHGDDAALRAALSQLPLRRPPARPTTNSTPRRAGQAQGGDSIFARVKASADVVVLARRLTDLHESGDGTRFTGLCPFHDDHHPSLIVWPATEDRAGRFCCRPCGVGGDVVELVRLALEKELLL